MAYKELIKDFNRIRSYMREFYVYGLKSREEYTEKSARSYDDERRRMESWLGDYMRFEQNAGRKTAAFVRGQPCDAQKSALQSLENQEFYGRRYYAAFCDFRCTLYARDQEDPSRTGSGN